MAGFHDLSYKNLFVATIVVLLVAGASLGAFWAYFLAGPIVAAPYVPVTTTTTETVGPTQTQAPTSISAETRTPELTVDLTGMIPAGVQGDIATIVVFLTVTNPSESSVTLTSIAYDVWINDVLVGHGGTNEESSVGGGSELEVRTELTSNLSELPQEVVDALIVEGATGILRIKGNLQVKNGFGTASVPFEGEGQIGLPIAT